MSLHKKVADRWLRKQAAPAMLRVILQELETLQELSENLTEIEDQIHQTFKMAKTLDPEVKSQFDALKKAREGLKQAQAVGEAVATILQQFPQDKTAQRAAKDAVVMIKRFQKHEAEARKIISRLSKKAMPPALKKMSASLARMLKSRLDNPKDLDISFWQQENKNWKTKREGIAYIVLFRTPASKDENGPRRRPGVGLAESTVHSGVSSVNVTDDGSYSLTSSMSWPNTTAKAQVANFVEKLRGTTALKGGEQKNKDRAAIASELYSELRSEWYSLYRGEGPSSSMSSNGMSMEFESRPLPRQDHGGGDDGDDWMSGSEIRRLEDREEKSMMGAIGGVLKKYKPYINNYSTDYGEKGHWTLYLYLK
jgi:hypothetical protein